MEKSYCYGLAVRELRCALLDGVSNSVSEVEDATTTALSIIFGYYRGLYLYLAENYLAEQLIVFAQLLERGLLQHFEQLLVAQNGGFDHFG